MSFIQPEKPPIGMIIKSPSAPSPGTWLACNGAKYTASTYSVLNARLGKLSSLNRFDVVTGVSAGLGGFNGIAFGNGFFLAVTQGGNVMKSYDGYTWFQSALITSFFAYTIAFGNGLFVAAGSNGSSSALIFTSTDGVTWVSRSHSFGNTTINAVTCGQNGGNVSSFMWVAVSENGITASSPDGITWTNRSTQFSAGPSALHAVGWGNGLFVIGGVSGMMSTSPDGVTWTTCTSGFGSNWIYDIQWGRGLFVAVGSGGVITTSPDGITWTARTSGFSTTAINSVGFGHDTFVAVGDSGKVSTSADGLTWTARTAIGDGKNNYVAYGNDQFVVVGPSTLIAAALVPAAVYTVATEFRVPWVPVEDGQTTWIRAL